MAESRRGLGFGVVAYSLWGLMPLFFPLLKPAGAVEILSHRVVWSLVLVLALVLVLRRTARLRAVAADRRTRGILTIGALVISVNWGTYIWGVNNGHVVEASLGYFINPLVTVLMAVVVLGERLRALQWAAVGLAAAAVVGLTVEYGHPPWVSLVLACSFGTYGLMKKRASVGTAEGLTWETMVLTPLALGYVGWLVARGESTFAALGPGHMLLLMSAGLATAVPLLFFGAATTRVSLTTIGLLQYITPTTQFLLGVLVFGEPMPAMRWVGFAVIWLALALFTAESVAHRRRHPQLAAESSAA